MKENFNLQDGGIYATFESYLRYKYVYKKGNIIRVCSYIFSSEIYNYIHAAIKPICMNEDRKAKTLGDFFEGALSIIVKSVGMILSYCGIPGLALILFFYFIEKHASAAQKSELIDSFLLMKNEKTYFLVFFYTVLAFVGSMLIQHTYWKRKDKLQQQRIGTLEKDNAKLQDKLIKSKK